MSLAAAAGVWGLCSLYDDGIFGDGSDIQILK